MSGKISRRSFMKQGAALGATSLIGSSLLSCSKEEDQPAKTEPKESAKAPERASNIVSVVTGESYFDNTIRAVEELGGMGRFVAEGATVAILANPQRNNPGAFTRPAIVASVVRMCKEAGAKEVACLSWLPEQNWENTGLAQAVREEGGKLILVDSKDEGRFTPVEVPKGVALKETRVLSDLSNYDVLIDMPITKDHAGNKFTGTMKNLMGLNSPKSNRTFHMENWQTDIDAITHLDQCIADLNTVITPNLSVVDGTEFITTNGPFGPGELIKPQKVIAGTDRIAIDSFCCTLWGLDAKDIIMINKGYEHGLGETDLGRVEIREIQA